MEPKIPPQTESRMQIPRLVRRAKRAIQINLLPLTIVDRPPNPRLLEIFENPAKEHVIPLLLNVNTTRPITYVQAIPFKSTR